MKRYILLFFIAITVLYACKEDSIKVFDSDICGIYFQRNAGVTYEKGGMSVVASRTYIDSAIYNFAESKSTTEFVKLGFPVKLIGKLADYDRKVNFKINKELTTGIEGADFEINYDTTTLKAGKNSVSVVVKVFRTLKLRTEKLIVALDLVESDDLKLLMNSYYKTTDWRNNDKTFPANTFKYYIYEEVVKPNAWPTDEYFGPWTIEKYNALNELMEWTADMWKNANNSSSGSPIAWGVYGYAAFNFKTYLEDMAAAGTPVKELDGSWMQLPGIYAPDYSKYE